MSDLHPILWQTKLHRPRVTRTLVQRPQLLEMLNNGADHRLIVVCAPAGFGKTTLISSWIESRDADSGAGSNRLRTAWLSLEETESKIEAFIGYVIAALRTLFDDACPNTLALLQARHRQPLELIATSLSNEIELLPDTCTLVLDDFQKIRGEAVTDLLNSLMLHWQQPLQVILISRTNPPLLLARLRANDQLTEIRSRQLRFTREETGAFLGQVLHMPVSPVLLERLEEKTEGWVGALRLTTLSIQGISDLESMLSLLDSSQESLVEYLVEEVLEKQLPAIRNFLLRTSILDRFCEHVTEELVGKVDPAWPIRACIDWLEREELFIVPLDEHRHWYRYHNLLQDSLKLKLATEMDPEQVQELHRRASVWYEGHGLVVEALKHALLAEDFDQAARLMARELRDAVNRTDWRTLEHWLGMMPEELIQQRPWLLMIRAWTLHFSWQLHRLPKMVAQIESLIEQNGEKEQGDSELRLLRGQIVLFKGQSAYYVNRMDEVRSFCEEALALIPESWGFARGGAIFYLALGMQASGDKKAARRLLLDQYELRVDKTDAFALRLLLALCFYYSSEGQLEKLRQTAVVLLQQATRGGEPTSRAWAFYFLGVVYYQWNELDLAHQNFLAVFAERYFAHQAALQNTFIGLALAHQARGESGEANRYAELAGQDDIETAGLEEDGTLSLRARLMLRQGHLDGAFRWADAYTIPLADHPVIWLEEPHLTRAQILIARGTGPDITAAQRILDGLLEIARRTHNKRFRIEVLATRAVALQAQGKDDDSQLALAQAVKLAESGGFLRVFVDQGPVMQEMLARLVARGKSVKTIERILAAFPEPAGVADHAVGPATPAQSAEREYPGLIEPLTPREKQILVNLREPMNIREIALKLDISYATAKRHTINIYGKLGVNSRWDAVARAEELGILPRR